MEGSEAKLFDEKLSEVLRERPGQTKQRLAVLMGVEYDEEFREKLEVACDRELIHRVQDKYYPGQFSKY